MKNFFKNLWLRTVRGSKVLALGIWGIVKQALTESIKVIIADITQIAIAELSNVTLADAKAMIKDPSILKDKVKQIVDDTGNVLEKEKDVVVEEVFRAAQEKLLESVTSLNE